MGEKHALPKHGEKLILSGGPDPQNNARLELPDDEWLFHAEGFKGAAQTLVALVLENNSELDFYVYPIIFNYRHYVELELKHIIFQGHAAGVAGIVADPIKLKHDLAKLWENARTVIEATWSQVAAETLDAAEAQIGELAQIDPGSYSARYPVDTKGRPAMLRTRKQINVRHFAETIEKLARLLECASEGMTWDQQDP